MWGGRSFGRSYWGAGNPASTPVRTAVKLSTVGAQTPGGGAATWIAGTTLSDGLAAEDNSYVEANIGSIGPDTLSAILIAKSFGFTLGDVPTGSTILGIEITVVSKASNAGVVTDNLVALNTAGDVQIGNIKQRFDTFPTVRTARAYGGGNDLWGATLTPAIITGADFGARMQFFAGTGDNFAQVDAVRMAITYIPPAGGGPTRTRRSFAFLIN